MLKQLVYDLDVLPGETVQALLGPGDVVLPDLEIVVKRAAARALALTRLGRLDEAEPLAREAVRYADGSQFLWFHADALVVLAEVLGLAGKPKEAATALEEAVALYERKGNVVSAAKTRALLEDLR